MIIPLIRVFQHIFKKQTPWTNSIKKLQKPLINKSKRQIGSFETNNTVAKAIFIYSRLKKKAAFGVDGNAKKAQKLITEEI